MLTSHGSFPRTGKPLEQAMVETVEFQRRHGMEIFTDGELRGDVLDCYADLPGIRKEGGVPRFFGRVRPLDDPTTFSRFHDLAFLQIRFPEARFKVNLTGPTTFAFSCGASNPGPAYRSAMDPRLHDDLTEAIRPLAHEYARRDVFVQIDDPILSQGMRDYTPALRCIDAIASEVPRDRMIVHVCGGLVRTKALDALLRLDRVATLALAFAGRLEQENVGLIDGKRFRDQDITLAVGSTPVQVATPEEVHSAAQVATLLRTVRDRVGPEQMRFVTPDCGFRATNAEFVSPILRSMREGFVSVFLSGSQEDRGGSLAVPSFR